MLRIINDDNLAFRSDRKAKVVFADCIYESLDFRWIDLYWDFLEENGVMIVMTDYHSVAQMKLHMDSLPESNFVNWAIYKQEWGGTPRKGFPQKHDDILIYSKGEDFYWDGDSVQIKKKTAGTKLDKKGTGLKTPCSVFDDLGNFSTIDKERVKDPESGKNIRWQKPMKLMDRLLLPFTKKGDLIIDPFCGSGTTPAWAHINGRDCYAIEKDKSVYEIALSRLKNND